MLVIYPEAKEGSPGHMQCTLPVNLKRADLKEKKASEPFSAQKMEKSEQKASKIARKWENASKQSSIFQPENGNLPGFQASAIAIG